MEAIFDHEKLDVCGLQLQFVAWTADFLIEASQSPVAHRRELLSQLDRACLSILLKQYLEPHDEDSEEECRQSVYTLLEFRARAGARARTTNFARGFN
jgi:hypothetical protein